MSQRIRGWGRRLVAVACGLLVGAALVLAGAAPVLAKSLHGGAHGRANVLVHSGPIVPLHGRDLIALAVAAAVACLAVVIDRRFVAHRASPLGRIGHRAAQSDQGVNRRRAA